MILCLLAVTLAAEPTPAPAAPSSPAPAPAPPELPSVDSARASAFADSLMEAGDPYNALTWYRLALFLEPDRPDAQAIRFREALAYERGQRYPAAVFAYGQVSGALADDAAYRSAVADFHAGNPLSADLNLERVPLFFPDSALLPQAAFARGYLALQSKDLSAAAQRFEAFNYPDSPLAPRAAALAASAREPLPHKSPALASALSLVPGLGQLYAHHPGDAAMAALVNIPLGVTSGLLIADAVENRRAGTAVAGGLLGLAFAFTYPSNVLGAYRGAQRENERIRQVRAEELLGQAYDPSLQLDPGEVDLP